MSILDLRYQAYAMNLAPSGARVGNTFHALNWADKPRRVLYDAVGYMRDAADTLSDAKKTLTEAKSGLCAHTGGADGACSETILRIDACLSKIEGIAK